MNEVVNLIGELSAGVRFADEIMLTEESAYREWSLRGSRSPKGE